MTNLLLHICCGVCASALVDKWRKDGIKITGYFYNPNIHPYQEFQKRLRAVQVLAEAEKIPVQYETEYGLRQFLKQVQDVPERCNGCYELRLGQTAQFARRNGFDTFSSTLIISPQQNQEKIKSIGEKIAAEAGISFKYEPITQLYDKSREIAKKRSLYRQQYCGCIYSEYERFGRAQPQTVGTD